MLVSGMFLSILYFPLGFALLNDIGFRQLFSPAAYLQRTATQLVLGAVLGLSLSVGLMGSLFTLMGYDGAVVMSLLGGAMLGLILVIVLAMRQRLQLPDGGRGWLIRGAFALLLLVAAGYLLPVRSVNAPTVVR